MRSDTILHDLEQLQRQFWKQGLWSMHFDNI